MGEETVFENGLISDFQGLVTLIFTLDRVILHTVMHHSSTSTYIPNFIEILRWADGHLRPTLLGRLGRVDLNIRSLPIEKGNLHISTVYHHRARRGMINK